MKKMLLGGLVAAALMPASSAMAAQNLGACTLNGNAALTPGLTSNQPAPAPSVPGAEWAFPQEVDWAGTQFTYNFSGALENCQDLSGDGPGGPASGTIYAGQPIDIGGVTWSWPFASPKGNGGCTGSHTEGTSVVVWDDNSLSVIDYTTDGVAAAIQLMGEMRSGSVTLSRPGPVDTNGNPTTITQSFPLVNGADYVAGPLAFHPADPTLCTSTGVTDAPISGVIGHGNYS